MTPAERTKARYERLRALGLCVRCAGQRDREGFVCSLCCDQHSAAQRSQRAGRGARPLRRVPPITMPADQRIVAYLAGLFDGEGSVGVYGVKHNLQLSIANTNAKLMTWLLSAVGGTVVVGNGRRPVHHWQLHGANAEVFLRAVSADVIVKAEQTAVALAFRELGQWEHARVAPEIREQRTGLAGTLRVLKRA